MTIKQNPTVDKMIEEVSKYQKGIISRAPNMKGKVEKSIRASIDGSLKQGVITEEEHRYILDKLGYSN